MRLVDKLQNTLWAIVTFLFAAHSMMVSDELVTLVDVRGIPGPHSFGRFCETTDGVAWTVGGMGHVLRLEAGSKPQNRRVGDTDWNGVFFANRDVGWVVGTGGTILHSTGSGVRWEKQLSHVTEDLQAISCLNQESCWIVGNSGIVLKTDDQGDSWKLLSTQQQKALYAVDFVDQQHGWAVGQGGIIVSTTDGGRSWNKISFELPMFEANREMGSAPWYSVKFSDTRSEWIAGVSGLAATDDGGKTWELKLRDEHFVGLAVNQNRVWAVGNDRNNYCSENFGRSWRKCQSE